MCNMVFMEMYNFALTKHGYVLAIFNHSNI